MSRYPEELLEWAGNRAGGVKKLFYAGSGRPSGDVIQTLLLERLDKWASSLGAVTPGTPHVVLLVGGPGNGKTEAIEFTINRLDAALGLRGELVREIAGQFASADGEPPPRRAVTNSVPFPEDLGIREVSIVQDASEPGPGAATSPAQSFVEDLRSQLQGAPGRVYLACVNRGVLDDALILAMEGGDATVGNLLKQVIQSVSLASGAPTCWPLDGYASFAVWPMDVETLVEAGGEKDSAAEQVLSVATNGQEWPGFGKCEAGERCPFCTNQQLLSSGHIQSSLLLMLRWFELASGKRWNFRDLFSLVSFLLAGDPTSAGTGVYSPCKWAAAVLSPTGTDPAKVEIQRKRGLLRLVASQYQHALFGNWPTERARQLRTDITELGLGTTPILAALHLFLAYDKRRESTSTLRAQLGGFSEFLDPAFASPGLKVRVSASSTITFDDLDRRFSLSVKEGRIYLQRYKCLSLLELELLALLEEADAKLSEDAVRRNKSATAERVQGLLRVVACRLGRRCIGAKAGVTRDADMLSEFHLVTNGDLPTLQEATLQVESLLNKDRRFVVSLNTTFGEPLPPPERQAILTTDVQRVRSVNMESMEGRPAAPVRFLKVGSAAGARPVALTFELFKATKALRKGLVPASLPRSVVALLDTTRARLAGSIVRNEEDLQNSEITVGLRDDVIVRTFGRFVVRRDS